MPAAECRMLASQQQQRLHIPENFLLLRSTSRLNERILRIVVPAAGKIAAIVRIDPAGKSDFIAIIQLRNPAQCQGESEGQLQFSRRTAVRTGKTGDIVICEKGPQRVWMGVQRIVAQYVRQAACRSVFQQDIAHREIKWKIEHCTEPAVDSIETLLPTYKKRSDTGIGMKYLSKGGEIGINSAQSGMPAGPELPRNIRESVDTQAVQPARLRPPDAVLQKILRDQRIFRIHVRQNSREPSGGEIARKASRGVRIDQNFERVIAKWLIVRFPVERTSYRRRSVQMMLRRAVKPVRQGRIRHPRMLRSDVIGHHVEENFHVPVVRLRDQLLIVLQCP